MLDDGLIVEIDDRPGPGEDDERRRYYRITPLGRNVARAEAQRLIDLVKMARASGFVAKERLIMKLYELSCTSIPPRFGTNMATNSAASSPAASRRRTVPSR